MPWNRRRRLPQPLKNLLHILCFIVVHWLGICRTHIRHNHDWLDWTEDWVLSEWLWRVQKIGVLFSSPHTLPSSRDWRPPKSIYPVQSSPSRRLVSFQIKYTWADWRILSTIFIICKPSTKSELPRVFLATIKAFFLSFYLSFLLQSIRPSIHPASHKLNSSVISSSVKYNCQ